MSRESMIIIRISEKEIEDYKMKKLLLEELESFKCETPVVKINSDKVTVSFEKG
jgi:hypothetical protein